MARPVVPGPSRRAERRQVTVLFCDLVDSVALSVALDPEDLMQVLDRYQAVCDDIIAQHGGYLAKFMGDGVLAYFGYPAADEEDAANAVRTALAIRDSAERLSISPENPIKVRIGIATGLVVVSDLLSRGEVREAAVAGETPNLAARLQSVAPPNGIVVSPTTRQITEGLFVYRPIGPVALKGFAAPVTPFEAVKATTVASRSRARAERSTTPLIGREDELALLLGRWAAARGGRGQVAMLEGEPGIGKSRLVEAVRRHVADTPHVQATWYCGPNHSTSALHPVTDQLARLVGLEHGEDEAARRRKFDRLLARFGGATPHAAPVLADLLHLPPPPGTGLAGLTAEKRREITLETLLDLMEAWARIAPALLVVEDAHWSDETTLELLDRAIRRLEGRACLILITSRHRLDRSWADRPDVLRLALERLDRGHAERICSYLNADAVLPPEIVRQIVQRTDGVPLFIEEMTRSVLEAVAGAPDRYGTQTVAIPTTLQDSLAARLDRLGPAKRVANLAAAIGRRFTHDLLEAVADMPPAALRHALRDLVQAGLLQRSGLPPNSTYLFHHALIRDAAYESLLKREREALHGCIARVLRDRFTELRDAEPELLAYHLTESGDLAEAIPLWIAAGQRAASRAAHIEAAGHLRRALDLLRQQPAGPARVEVELGILLGLAVSLSAARGYSVPEVGDVLAEARALCDAPGSVASMFAVLRNICSFLIVANQLDDAEDMARRCLKIGQNTGDPMHCIEGEYAFGYVMFVRGQLAAARRHLDNAIRLYRTHDGSRIGFPSPQDPLVGALCAQSFVLHALGETEATDRVLAELAAHLTALGRSYDLVYGLCFQASLQTLRGRFECVREVAAEALRVCRDQGYPLWNAVAAFYRAVAMGQLDDRDRGLELALEANLELDRIGTASLRGIRLGDIASLQLAAGDAAAALASITAGIKDVERAGECYFLPELLRRRAAILAAMPRGAPAVAASAAPTIGRTH